MEKLQQRNEREGIFETISFTKEGKVFTNKISRNNSTAMQHSSDERKEIAQEIVDFLAE
jgi:hypothetical protein